MLNSILLASLLSKEDTEAKILLRGWNLQSSSELLSSIILSWLKTVHGRNCNSDTIILTKRNQLGPEEIDCKQSNYTWFREEDFSSWLPGLESLFCLNLYVPAHHESHASRLRRGSLGHWPPYLPISCMWLTGRAICCSFLLSHHGHCVYRPKYIFCPKPAPKQHNPLHQCFQKSWVVTHYWEKTGPFPFKRSGPVMVVPMAPQW